MVWSNPCVSPILQGPKLSHSVQESCNPKEFDVNPSNARFFVMKSYSEDDVYRSIKYSIWCSSYYANKILDKAFLESGLVYLLFSVNGSYHFCGVAQMLSKVNYSQSTRIWTQDVWSGQFEVKWIYVKDVPNPLLHHIRLPNNNHKPVSCSRNTQEVPAGQGKEILKIFHDYNHKTSIFDDFSFYDDKEEERLKQMRN